MPPADERRVCEITFHVRYAETDTMGVVHHAVYFVWFEEGRSAFIREQGWSYADIEASGFFLVAAELEARFLRAVRYDQQITVRTWIEDFKSRAIVFGCQVVDSCSGQSIFSASLKLICVNSSGQSTRIPPTWHAWLKS